MSLQHKLRRPIKMGRQRQSGIALLVLVFSISMILTAVAYKVLNARASKLLEQQSTANALAEAKAALIGYALADSALPGRLPCPEDLTKIGTVYEGSAKTSCNTNADRIGRLPWRTLGIGKVVDGNGEPLWYVLSDHFRTEPINSETIPTLSLNGVANAAVAIIFSPGPALNNQIRTAVTASSLPSQANYLDQGNADTDTTFFRLVTDSTFNDQLITISHADIFEPLEKRVLGEIRNNAATYKNSWHAYPFPVEFTNPSALADNNFVGNTSESGGLLPVSDPAVAANMSVTSISMSPGFGNISNPTCSLINPGSFTNERIECSAQLAPLFTFFIATGNIQFGFSNVGKAFVGSTAYSTSDFTTSTTSSTYTIGLNSVGQQVDSAANGLLRVGFTIFNNFTSTASTIIRISIRISNYPDVMDSWTLASSSWLIKNNWHRLVYYQIANPYRPNGSLSAPICNSNCLTVRRSYANGNIQNNADIPGVVMTAGKVLSSTDFQATPSQSRGSDFLKEYFDSDNNVNAASTLIFDQILPLKSTFNDQLQTLQP